MDIRIDVNSYTWLNEMTLAEREQWMQDLYSLGDRIGYLSRVSLEVRLTGLGPEKPGA